MRKSLLTLSLLASIPFGAQAEVYCVSTAAQVRAAFSDAASSPTASEIRVRTGFYVLPPLTGSSIALQYLANSSLTMSGGWTGSNGSCTGQVADPEQTVLSADGAGGLLRFFLLSGANTEVNLSNFSFRQSNATAAAPGASCVEIASDAGANGIVRIDRNAFRLCTRQNGSGSALDVSVRSTTVYVRNNVFTDNASSSGIIYLAGVGGATIFFNNNTIANNPQSGSGGGPGGMQLVSIGSGNAFWMANNVLWNNGTGTGYDLLVNSSVSVALNNNLVGEAAPLPAGALNNNNLFGVDPRFTASVDFRPRADSPLRNSGVVPAGGLLDVDFAGGAREQGVRVDRGAFEFSEVFANGFE